MLDLPVRSFETRAELRTWLESHAMNSDGLWVRLYKKKSKATSISFQDLLEEGLCFGWSESNRKAYDDESYLQCFTPRRRVGTASPRNLALVKLLSEAGLMRPEGMKALGL